MLNILVSLLLVMFEHKGQYFKTNTSVTSSILSSKHTYQLTSTKSVTFVLAYRSIRAGNIIISALMNENSQDFAVP